MKLLLLLSLLLITGCSSEPVINKNEPTYTTDNKTGYYWRDTYNHRWSNAPPPGTTERWHQ